MGFFFGLTEKVQQAIIVALLVAIVALAGVAIWFRLAASAARLEAAQALNAVAQLQANVATCKANGETLEGGIKRQNEAVEAVKADLERRLAISEAARKDAERRAGVEKNRAQGILNIKPTPGKTACEDAMDLYRRERE